MAQKKIKKWLGYLDSNQGMTESKSVALPLGYTPKMAVPTGIAPAISCVTGRHVNRYTTGPTFKEKNIKMEEVEGFEPPRGVTRLSVFKTDPFSRTWVYLQNN